MTQNSRLSTPVSGLLTPDCRLRTLDSRPKANAELERVARRQVLLSTPVGKYEQHPFDGNPYQEHKYIWNPKNLRAIKLRSVGFRGSRALCFLGVLVIIAI